MSEGAGGDRKPFYRPEVWGGEYGRDLGAPGQFPFTRGLHPDMYRGRLWTMRQYAGFGTAEETYARFRYQLSQGQTGLSVAFDLPTQMGYDSSAEIADGEVGKVGVAIDTVEDMKRLFDEIPLEQVSTSMTINAPAAVMLAFYVVAAERQGVPPERLGGTIQTDILKEYIAQKEWCFPIEPAMRLVTDMIEWCSREMPRWHPISISGYHIREAGSTAQQELAFTLKDGFTYVETAIERGLDVDDFAPRLSFFFNAHIDFFEEIAKYRAARRIWAREMRSTYGAERAESQRLRFHTQAAGVSLTAQQPLNNIIRPTIEALAGVLGGTQSLHTNSLDETYALPTEEAVTIALRTQQLIAHESGGDRVVDPLAGSYYVEYLTDEMERRALEYIRRIDEMGGMVVAVERGYPQREIAASAYRLQRQYERGDKVVVGVNKYVQDEGSQIPLLRIDEAVQRDQIAALRALKTERDAARVARALDRVREAAQGTANLVPPIIEAAKAYRTEQEICDVLRDVFGQHQDRPEF